MTRHRRLLHTVPLLLALAGTAHAQQLILRHDEAAPGRLDPQRVADYAASVLAMNVYDTLVLAKPGGGMQPSLAESWTPSEDGKTYTFKLRPGVKFHAGGEVTAEDVVFTLERTLALNAGFARLFKGVSATATDAHTVVFTIPVVNASFLASLVRLPVIEKSVVLKNIATGPAGERGDWADAWLSTHDAGSGAYRVTEHSQQEQTVLQKFPDYFAGFAKNAPDVVRIRYGVEPATLRTLMSRKEWEVTSQWIPIETKRALAESPGMSLIDERGLSFFIMSMNTQRAPTDDVHVRRAIAHAVDFPALIALHKIGPSIDGAIAMHGTLPSGLLGYDPSIPPIARDVAAAKAELAQSKYGATPPPIDLIWVAEVPVEEKIGLLVQQNLAEIGIKVNLVKVPWTLLIQQATKPETTPHMTQRYASAPYPDADSLISQSESTYLGTTTKMDWWSDAEFDKLLAAGRAALDDGKRKEIYVQAQKRLLDNMPDLFAFETIASFARQNYVAAPSLEKPENNVAVQGGNWLFRTFSVNK